MHLFNAFSKLELKNFRSYSSLLLNFESYFTIFTGANGAGKTNILEAISLFSSGNGLRKANFSSMLNTDCKHGTWGIQSILNINNCDFYLKTSQQNVVLKNYQSTAQSQSNLKNNVQSNSSRKVEIDACKSLDINSNMIDIASSNNLIGVSNSRIGFIDNRKIASFKAFDDLVWMLWLTPMVLNIFLQNNTDIRKFFDHLVSSFWPLHKVRLKTLNTLLKERMQVLTKHQNNSQWLEILEQRIIDESLYIHLYRQKFILLLEQELNCFSKFKTVNVLLDGEMENVVNSMLEEDAIVLLKELFKNNRQIDFYKQSTSLGAHKTHVNFMQFNRNISQCSTGEQNVLLLTIIIACIKINKKHSNTVPILLLDDVMAHLDASHRCFLLDELRTLGIQTFLTGTEKIFFQQVCDIGQFISIQSSICY